MGTQEEEAAALAALERARTEAEIARMQREEEMRRLREQEQNKMVADPGTSDAAWPDNEVTAAPGLRDQVAGALRVGKAGDVAFAKQLLDAERRTGGGSEAGESRLDGAKERVAGALNPRAARPAVER